MTDLRIRNMNDEALAELRARAKRDGVTLEALSRELLVEGAFRPRRALAAELAKFQEALREQYGILPDSTPGIREERDRRG